MRVSQITYQSNSQSSEIHNQSNLKYVKQPLYFRYLKICHPTKRSLTGLQARNIGLLAPLVASVVAAPILVWEGNVDGRFCRVLDKYRGTLGELIV